MYDVEFLQCTSKNIGRCTSRYGEVSRHEIVELIELGYECEFLDFKERQHHKDKSMDLLMAMANFRHNGDKFIIIGVKDRPEGKEIKGIDPKEFTDSSNYVQPS